MPDTGHLIHVPTYPELKLGRMRVPAHQNAGKLFHFDHMKTVLGITPEPLAFDYLDTFPDDSGVMKNDTLGCCAFAEPYHAFQVVIFKLTGHFIAGEELTPLVEAFYQECGGYDPKAALVPDPQNPGQMINPTDQGGDMVAIAQWVLKHGLTMLDGVDHFRFAFQVDVSNPVDLSYVGAHCLGLGLGVVITDKIMPSDGSGVPTVWPAGGTPLGGHAIRGARRDAAGVWGSISWGQKFGQAVDFMKPFKDDGTGGNLEVAVARIDERMFVGGKTVMGQTIDDLKAYAATYATEIGA